MFWKFYCMHYTIGKNKSKYILSKVYQILLKLLWFKRFRFTIINIISIGLPYLSVIQPPATSLFQLLSENLEVSQKDPEVINVMSRNKCTIYFIHRGVPPFYLLCVTHIIVKS